MVTVGGDVGGEEGDDDEAPGDDETVVLIVLFSEIFSIVSVVALLVSSSGMGTINVSAVIRSYLVTNFVKRRHKLVSFCNKKSTLEIFHQIR